MLARVFRQCAIVSGLAESAAIMVRRYGNERVSRPAVRHAKRRLRDPSIGDVFAVEKGRVEKAAQIGAQPLRQRVEVLDVRAFIAHFSYIRDRRLRKSAQLGESVLRHVLLFQKLVHASRQCLRERHLYRSPLTAFLRLSGIV